MRGAEVGSQKPPPRRRPDRAVGSGCIFPTTVSYSATPAEAGPGMDHLDQLEQQSVYIFREAFRHFERLCMLWSIGKDSTVLLWLARKAFFGHISFPLVHI